MEDFIQGEDYEFWDRVAIEPTIPVKNMKGVGQVPKVQSEFTPDMWFKTRLMQ